MKRLIYTRGGGRMGNQLINYINLYGFHLEKKDIQVVNLAFLPYAEEYGRKDMELSSLDDIDMSGLLAFTTCCLWSQYGSGTILGKPTYKVLDLARLPLVHKIACLHPEAKSVIGGNTNTYFSIPGEQKDYIDLSDSQTCRSILGEETSIVSGWNVRAWKLVRKHKKIIREEVQPGSEYVKKGKKHIKKIRNRCDCLVGVLIRQDDYRGGSYFFESEQYKEWMERVSELNSIVSGKVNFLIASDESQSRRLFSDKKYRFCTGAKVGGGHYMENFVELSMCDLIMTPPSTFSVVSAFTGGVPIIPLYEGVLDDGFDILKNPLMDSLEHSHMGEMVN